LIDVVDFRSDVFIMIDVYIPSVNATSGIFLGARVTTGGCDCKKASGIYFGVQQNTSTYIISTDISKFFVAHPYTHTYMHIKYTPGFAHILEYA